MDNRYELSGPNQLLLLKSVLRETQEFLSLPHPFISSVLIYLFLYSD